MWDQAHMVEIDLNTNFLWRRWAAAYLDSELTLSRLALALSLHVTADVTQRTSPEMMGAMSSGSVVWQSAVYTHEEET